MNDGHRCVVCNEPTSASVVVGDDENEIRLWLCQVHAFDMTRVRILL